eukprot:scaffold19435_cov73-Skeletonema_marinoi.AAC.2
MRVIKLVKQYWVRLQVLIEAVMMPYDGCECVSCAVEEDLDLCDVSISAELQGKGVRLNRLDGR